MDQKKIGSFLKELRKEKGLTQEQLAERLKVSSRSVSRWETGNNMPDLSILVELSDFIIWILKKSLMEKGKVRIWKKRQRIRY